MKKRAVLVVDPPPAAAAGESVDAGDRRIVLHDLHELLHQPLHGLKGGILIGLNRAHQAPAVLLREESFGRVNKQIHVQPDGAEQHQERDGRMPQHSAPASSRTPPRWR